MEHHPCSGKGDDIQPLAIPKETASQLCKRIENNQDTEGKCELVGYGRIVSGDDEPFYGPFRLKDGLFFSLCSVVVDKEFLKANKVSHIIAIDEDPQQRFEESQASLTSEEQSQMAIPRSLTLHWHRREEPDDPVILKEKMNDLARVVAFIDEAVEQGGSCLLHSSNDLTTAAAAATVYFVVKRPPFHLRPVALALLKSADLQRFVLQSLAGRDLAGHNADIADYRSQELAANSGKHWTLPKIMNVTVFAATPATEAECLLLHNTIANGSLPITGPPTTHTGALQ
ncbi:uncharacterized protein EMH_0025240 [Eimeria mitis]|uniref:Uncharacterized protein n=1 Tax=Eimeria mitis TaxID=44415 RepID=U6JWH2_9EIME|nr:uncharacterized protein EMH_0025240 [Eimeria mitis]CDJ29131.1 hypothetical protein, conserved [Eimeria mitis]